jgi:AcrR family transcriptional regulator
MPMRTRNAEQTKQRIFDAATAEFSAHGVAGARVDRIAVAAKANKQLIYAHFGSKRGLFEAVVSERVTRFVHDVPFDAYDLPNWAGETFDFFVANAEVPQLAAWHALEPEASQHRIPIIEREIRKRIRQIKQAQATQHVSRRLPAAELLAIANAIAGTWSIGVPERNPRRGVGAAELARRRAAVVEAVRALAAP